MKRFLSLIFSLGMLTSSQAAVITVNTLTETALESAIQSANPTDTIYISGFGIINFTDSITIDKPLTITTGALGAISLSGTYATKIFHINTSGDANIYLSNLRFMRGYSLNPGGVINYTATGTGNFLRIKNCIFSENTSQNAGGAIAVHNEGSLLIDSTTFIGNSGAMGGGAIAAMGDRNIDIENAYFTDNTALANGGGAIYVGGTSGVSIEKVTFYNNTAPTSNGGGLFVNSSSHSIVNSTFYSNSANNGGAIYTNDLFGNVSMTSCTVYANTATTDGGGFYMNGGISMTHTVLAANEAALNPNDFTRDPTNQPNLISNNYNFIGYDPGVEVFGPDPNDQIGTIATIDPMLGTLKNNGGYAQTLMPLSSSPLIDAGDITAISFVNEDQTGGSRTANGVPDIGAVEYVAACDILLVTRTDDALACGTLRSAIEYANQNPYSTISFNIDDPIILSNPLPAITGEGTEIQGMDNGIPVRIDGQGLATGLNIQADYVSLSGLSLEGFTDYAIYDLGHNALSMKSIYIGVNPLDNESLSGPATGIFVKDAYDIYLGENQIDVNIKAASTTNYVANCSNVGVYVENVIGELRGFYVGTDLFGTMSYPNAKGMMLENCNSNFSIVNCLVSGNNGSGIHINNSSFVSIRDNTIGLDEVQTTSLQNTKGIEITNSNALTIGPDNYISGNSNEGIYAEDSRELLIIGNNIGLGATGKNPLNDGYSNWPGIELENTPKVTIGGTTPSDRNIISGNLNGIQVNNGSDSVVILGNYIGLDPTGMFARQSSGVGIGVVRSDYARIGDGTTAGSNVIGGSIDCISFTRGYNFIVDRNILGVDVTGTKKIAGYGGDGIRMANFGTVNSNDTIRNNIIAFRNTPIVIATSADSVIVTQNAIYGNDQGIILNTNSNAQQGVKPPRIDNYNGTAYVGTAGPNAKIEVFADKADQGQLYLGSTTADAGGAWSFTYDNSSIPLGLNYITAIQDSAGQSSQFSLPYEWQDCSYLTANILTEESDTYSCEDTISLEAETPSVGSGLWDCITVGGTIVDQTAATTVIRDLPLGSSEYKWVVTDGSCQVEASIEVNYEGYKRVNGGQDQIVTGDFAMLNGVPLSEGETGGKLPIVWSLLSGDGEFDNPSDPNTTISGLAPGSNMILFYAFTEFGFCPGLDTVEIYYNIDYAQPDAGEDQIVCYGEVILDANYPGLQDASFGWSYYSGPSTPTFDDPQDPKTKVTGLVDGTYEFIWSIDDGNSIERDTVTIFSASGPPRPTPNSWLVNNLNDAGCGSLRQAVLESLAGDTIIIDPTLAASTIDLTSGEIVVDHEITIIGNSPKTLLHNATGPVFMVDMAGELSLNGVEFFNSVNALKIVEANSVTMDSVCFRLNERAILDSSQAQLIITKSLFLENVIFADGAAILKPQGGGIAIDSSKFIDNWSDNYSGGGIYAVGMYLDIRYSEFDNNTASLRGGGVYLQGGYLSVYSSTFKDNTAYGEGGGIALDNFLQGESYGSIVNATFSGNFSDGRGAAIAADTSELNVVYSTIYNNNTYSGAAGIYSSNQNIFLKSSIVAENKAYGNPFDIECEGCLVRSFGNNFIGDTSSFVMQITGVGDTLGNSSVQADPLLEDLVFVNGLFHVHIPMVNSPVIDKGGNESGYILDQLGNQRPFDGEESASDIGAVEYQKALPCTDSLYVTITDNDGCGSLRAAVIYANNNPGNDTITFDPALQGQTIELYSEIAINESVTIYGVPDTNGEPVILTGITNRVFSVYTDQNDFTVTLHDLSFQNCFHELGGEDGGAMKFDYNGNLFLKRCEFINNIATGYGGGLFFNGDNFRADSCVFSENSTDEYNEGGALYLSVVGGNAYFNDCLFEYNHAGSDVFQSSAGGAASTSVSYGEIVFDRCLFNGNYAGEGGGLYTYGDGIDSVVVKNSTFTENQGWEGGGAIYAGNSGEVFLINSTLVSNYATGYAGSLVEGGAVYGRATIYMANSVFALNEGDPANIRAYAYEVESWGYNFIDDTSNTVGYDAFYSPLDIKGYSGNVLDADLDPLEDNGGFTQSMMPQPGSVLIDAGNDAYATETDQNNNLRISGNAIDIGSVEVQEVICADSLYVTVTDNDGCGSLRAAVLYANIHPGIDTITFAPSLAGQTITLLSTIIIEESIVIEGIPDPNEDLISLFGSNDRIFDVYSTQTDFSVAIYDLKFEDTDVYEGGNGGAIKYEVRGDLLLKRCVFDNNGATESGGALYFAGTDLAMDSCIFRGNGITSADGSGGAAYIQCFNGNGYISNTVIEGNYAGPVSDNSKGGGFSVSISTGEIVIDKCTFENNSAGEGGALYTEGNDVDSVVVYNSTFTGNSAWKYAGGAIYASSSGDVYLFNSTLVSNSALLVDATELEGGAVYSAASVYFANSVFANNLGDPSNIAAGYSGRFTSLGNNFISDTSGTSGALELFHPTDIKGGENNVLSPSIDELIQNSFTKTFSPYDFSPLVNAGNNAFATTTDQNHDPRIVGGIIDIGAVEYQDFSCEDPIADAGEDRIVCGDNTTLNANEPANGDAGEWSFYSGSGSFDDPTLYNAEVTNLLPHDNILIWEVSNTCGVAYDTIVVYSDTGFTANDDYFDVPEGAADFELPFYENDSSLVSYIGVGLADAITGAPVYGTTNVDETLNFSEILYTPTPAYYGNDTIDYEVVDICERSGFASIFITVVPYLPDFPRTISRQVLSGKRSSFTFYMPEFLTDYGISDSLNNGKGSVTLNEVNLTVSVDFSINPDFVGLDSMQFYFCKGTVCDSTYLKLSVGNIIVEEPTGQLEIFDGFSPNGDGKNDYFHINYDENIHAPVSVKIVNRWGDRVFKTDDYNNESNRWDGTKNGNPLPDGAYYYFVKTKNNEEKIGTVILKK